MMPPETTNEKPNSWLWIISTFGIILFAIAIRVSLNFRHPLAPGMDAAFYPLQTIWLMQRGELMFSDMPLIFWLNSALTTMLMACGFSLIDAAMLASRWIDSMAQPLTALPLMLLGYRWSGGKRSLLVFCLAATAIAVLSPPIFRMAGDFQKNSLALVWMAFSIWSLNEAMRWPKIWNWMRVAVFFFLTAITHVGTLSATVVVLASCLMGFLIVDENVRKRWLKPNGRNAAIFVAIGFGMVAIALIMWQLAPAKSERFFNLERIASKFHFRADPTWFLTAIFYAVLAWITRWLWKEKQNLAQCDFAVGFGMTMSLTLLTLPFLDPIWRMRFALMTPVPAAVLLALLFTHFRIDQKSKRLRYAVLGIAGLLAAMAPFFLQGPVLNVAAVDELRRLRSEQMEIVAIGAINSEDVLIVAPHGVEFWVGLILGTEVRQYIPQNRSTYDRVLLLEPKPAMSPHPHSLAHAQRPPAPSGFQPPAGHHFQIPETAKEVYECDSFKLYQMPADATN